jgi:hypothetical protein
MFSVAAAPAWIPGARAPHKPAGSPLQWPAATADGVHGGQRVSRREVARNAPGSELRTFGHAVPSCASKWAERCGALAWDATARPGSDEYVQCVSGRFNSGVVVTKRAITDVAFVIRSSNAPRGTLELSGAGEATLTDDVSGSRLQAGSVLNRGSC